MKKLLFFLMLGLMCACMVEYDGSERWLVEMRIVDSQNNPIQGANVIIATGSNDYAFDYADHITSQMTDSRGMARLAFPKRTNNTEYYIQIEQQGFIYREIKRLTKDNFPDYKLPIDEVALYRESEIVQLSIDPQPVSGATLKNYYVVETTDELFVNARPINGFQQVFNVPKNTSVTLKYRTENANLVQENQVVIPIGNASQSYTLNF